MKDSLRGESVAAEDNRREKGILKYMWDKKVQNKGAVQGGIESLSKTSESDVL
jgi:hypothetical protein